MFVVRLTGVSKKSTSFIYIVYIQNYHRQNKKCVAINSYIVIVICLLSVFEVMENVV